MVADDLTRQPHPRQSFLFHLRFLGQRHARRFAADELDAARRAAGIAAAGVENVNVGVLLDREHQPLAGLDINSGKPFNGQLGHARYVNVSFTHGRPAGNSSSVRIVEIADS